MISDTMYYSAPLLAFEKLLTEIYELVERVDSVKYWDIYDALKTVSPERQEVIRLLNNPVQEVASVFLTKSRSLAEFAILDEEYFGHVETFLTHVSELIAEALPHMNEITLKRLAFDHDWFTEKFAEVKRFHAMLTPIHTAMETHLVAAVAENVIVGTGTKPWQREALDRGMVTYYTPLIKARDEYFEKPSDTQLGAYIEVAESLRANPHWMLTDNRYSFYYRSNPERRASADLALEKLVTVELMIGLTHG